MHPTHTHVGSSHVHRKHRSPSLLFTECICPTHPISCLWAAAASTDPDICAAIISTMSFTTLLMQGGITVPHRLSEGNADLPALSVRSCTADCSTNYVCRQASRGCGRASIAPWHARTYMPQGHANGQPEPSKGPPAQIMWYRVAQTAR